MSDSETLPAEARQIAAGYAFSGPPLDLGALLRNSSPDWARARPW
ncbi:MULTISPECIES: hypothetical protein [unclassified Streptomyces]|nr:hypothetical protein [Streptomyces sp. BK340]TVZ93958.1 hypothetical protein FB157_10517 [Streptomyces sp. BK340]